MFFCTCAPSPFYVLNTNTKLGKTLYAATREEWRAWLSANHASEAEIWLIYYKKHAAKPRIPYNDAIEEALCFGWIDIIVKTIDADSYAQRYSPRRKNSKWSEMNKECIRRLVKDGRVAPVGLTAAKSVLDEFWASTVAPAARPEIAADIFTALKQADTAWEKFHKFPGSYNFIRIGWIEGARNRPELFNRRLRYFVKMTSKNKQFGMVR